MIFQQTVRGAVAFVRMVPDPAAASSPTRVHLGDGVTVLPDATGGYHVRSMDIDPLLASGLVIGAGAAGVSSIAQFQAGVFVGQGAGTAT